MSLAAIQPQTTSAATERAPLAALLGALAVGIVGDRYAALELALWFWLALACGCAWGLCYRANWNAAALAWLLLATASLGGAWHHVRWRWFAANDVGRYAIGESKPACLQVEVLTPPQRINAPPFTPLVALPRGDATRMPVRITAMRVGNQWRPASGWAKLHVEGHLLGVRVGDRLQVLAFLSRSPPALNLGEFDFQLHDRCDRLLCRLRATMPDCVEVQQRGFPLAPRNLLGLMRDQGKKLLAVHLDPQREDLAGALLLGMRESLPYEENQTFLKTGTIHILSISGLHIGILAAFLMLFARSGLLPRRGTLVAITALITVYAVLADANPPVVRATVLVGLVCGAALLGRRPLAFNVLAAAGLAVLALNPADLFRAGTQLSFLAVATLAWFSPYLIQRPTTDPLDRLIEQSRPAAVRWMRNAGSLAWRSWLAGALIWLTSLPLVMHHYHLVSPVAVVANPLIAVPSALGLVAGFGLLLCGWLVPPLGAVCGWTCNACLGGLQAIIHAAEHFPASYWWVAGPAAWWVLGCYLLWLAYILGVGRQWPVRWKTAVAALWLAAGLFSTVPLDRWTTGDHTPLRCTFVAVGHGTSALLEFPGGEAVLYDCGGMGGPFGVARDVGGTLWSRGRTHLHAVVVSHADIDHYNGLPELLQRFSVGAIYVSPIMFRDDTPALRELRTAIANAGVPLREMKAGDRLTLRGNVLVEALHPPKRGIVGSDNANSIVLNVEHAGQRLLLPGDLESPGLDDLLAELPLDCSVVMVPHHGSSRSNPAGFAAWSSPEHVVISGGWESNIWPVRWAYTSAGARVSHTAQHGAVSYELGPNGVCMQRQRGGAW